MMWQVINSIKVQSAVMEWMILMVGGVVAYLLGSISSAVLVCQVLRLPDPRTHGSHNPGTTNVLRLSGRFPAALTLIGDVAKGYIPVALVQCFTHQPWIIMPVLLAAVCGHLFPIFFQFKGGKGVATALGGLFALSLSLGGVFVFTWLGIFALTRYSSLSALIAIVSLPFWAWHWLGIQVSIGLAILALLIVVRHQSNIERLVAGKEAKFKLKKDASN